MLKLSTRYMVIFSSSLVRLRRNSLPSVGLKYRLSVMRAQNTWDCSDLELDKFGMFTCDLYGFREVQTQHFWRSTSNTETRFFFWWNNNWRISVPEEKEDNKLDSVLQQTKDISWFSIGSSISLAVKGLFASRNMVQETQLLGRGLRQKKLNKSYLSW